MAHHDKMSREARATAFNALRDAEKLVEIAIRQLETAAQAIGGFEGDEILTTPRSNAIQALYDIRKCRGHFAKKPAWLRQR